MLRILNANLMGESPICHIVVGEVDLHDAIPGESI